MRNWFLRFIGNPTLPLGVGHRVITSRGRGVITGGSLTVRMDEPFILDEPNQRIWSFNIDKEKVEHA